MSELQPEQIIYTCPRCRQNMGRPYRFADDGPSRLRVLIRCQHCLHRWSEMIARSFTK
ncbi:MAG: hypothetical protein K2Y23_15455 [Cyanobacteria bacterium]|nr:hypothetical protein [Cyanobacteriota bacterium]